MSASNSKLPPPPYKNELRRLIEAGRATDEQIAEFLGPDLCNQLNASFSDPEWTTQPAYAAWYEDVLKPLDIPYLTGYLLYTGEISIAGFTANLSDDQAANFVEKFPALQRAYQSKLDAERSQSQGEPGQ